MKSEWYLFCLSVIVLARLCVFGTAISVKKVFFAFLSMNVISGRLKGIVLSVSMLLFQYSLKLSFCSTLAGVYRQIVQAFFFHQLSYFCQFLVDNFGQSIMSLQILGRCQLLTCRSNVLDRLRFFSTSSAQLLLLLLLLLLKTSSGYRKAYVAVFQPFPPSKDHTITESFIAPTSAQHTHTHTHTHTHIYIYIYIYITTLQFSTLQYVTIAPTCFGFD